MNAKQWITTIALGLSLAAGGALAADGAAARVDAARAALEAARAELAAAEADLAAAQTVDVQPSADDAGKAGADAIAPKQGMLQGFDWSLDVGLNGSTGNSENFAFRAGLGGTRSNDKVDTTIGLSYRYASAEGNKSANRFDAFARNDWKLKNPRWSFFAQGKYEWDEFQAWDHRLSGHLGFGYKFIDNDKTTLTGRAGLGGSYEIGGPNEKFVPEGFLGLDLTHKLSEKSTFKAGTEYYPSFDDFGEFRWNNYAKLEVLLDEQTNLFWNAGLEHRHQSDPGAGVKNNDLDYYMGLGWKF